MNCQICDNPGYYVFKKNDFNILKCKPCNHFFAEIDATSHKVNEIYSDSYFYGGEDGYPDYTIERELLIKKGEYYSNKISQFIKRGKVLDVGAAAGFILKGFENTGWTGMGLEPNQKMVLYGKKEVGVDLYQGTIETSNIKEEFDLIILIQVIGHLSDINSAVKKCSEYLYPGGHILIESWNSASLTSKLFGKYWHEFSPPSTLNYFNNVSLDKLMEKFNFLKIKSGIPQKKIHSNHAKSLLKHNLQHNILFRKISALVNVIPDNILLPYPAEDLYWALYRKII